MYASTEFAGGLIVYGVHYPEQYRLAASFADKIFKGAKPADLPVEQPTKFELVINLKAANALGLTIPVGSGDPDQWRCSDGSPKRWAVSPAASNWMRTAGSRPTTQAS